MVSHLLCVLVTVSFLRMCGGARNSTVAGQILSADFSEASLSKYLVFKTEYFWVKQD